ncbi:hypothetical protein bas50_0124 [Escherichia phage DrSchubert]|uniref:Uncharacterized protein n=1 Tax=Escherichia phage DrSchubert TaxID=2852022 RepID=A0AAE7VQU2_9CAUD|nr:hypothetical protein bas50_0124 [Escherichia phage DrSchubert]
MESKINLDNSLLLDRLYFVGRGNKATPINDGRIMLDKIFTVVVVGLAL